MFKLFEMKALLSVWRRRYCESDQRYPDCERYRLMIKGRPVADTLLPNGMDLNQAARKQG